MLQRLGIRGKLLAVVMVPVLVLVAAVAYISVTASRSYSSSSNAERLVDTLGQARETEGDLQTERTAALTYVHVIQDTNSKLVDAQDEVTRRWDTLASEVDKLDSPAADSLLAFAADQLGGAGADMLPEARAVKMSAPETEGDWVVMPTAEEVAAMDKEYSDASRSLDTMSNQAPEELDLALEFAALSFAIEQEAAYAHTLFSDTADLRATLEATFPKVDSGLDDIAAEAATVEANEDNAAALASVAAGSALRDSLPGVRAGVRSATLSPSAILKYYTEVVDTFVDATDAVALAVPDRNVVATLQAYGSLDRLIERVKYEGDAFDRLIRQGAFVTAEIANTRTIVERTRLALEDAQARGIGLSPAIEVPDFGASASSTGSSFTTIQGSVLTGLDSALATSSNADWPAKVQLELDQYIPLREEAWDRTTSAISANSRNALSATYLTLAIGVGAVVGSLLIAFAISRRIVNPLRRLTTTASAVREELPRLVERVAQPGEDVDVSEVQITVESQDEVGRLAEAFNGVNAATIEIAREQAALRGSISEMFVNVARRDQVLLNRQLSSIDEMERSEDDPDRLTRLFALDHLATRMRRNSESLLVLAGIDTGRRLRRPMPLSDVVRTASSEIELYERVDLDLVVDPAMLGHQALTAAHLFAELLENATVFSDPGSRVVVRTGRTEEGFTVEVIDTGIGMTEAELVEANSRVQSSAASEILGAQRLGLFVVGRIARRLGAQVALSSLEGRGTVATVFLPSALFEAPEATAPAATAPAAGAYAPTAVVEGASLSGRGAEEPAVTPAPVAVAEPEVAAPAVEDDDSIPMPVGLEALIAADAAAAPVVEEVSGPELTSGTTTAGLPTRRRRDAEAPVEAPAEPEQTGVGLPVRATADQLDALDAEASAFTPAVSPAEVAPQTPEERASVFRGFRARRDAEQPGAAEPLPAVEPPVMAEAIADEAPTEPAAPVLPTRAAGGAFAAYDAFRRASEAAAEQPAAAPEPAPMVEPVLEPLAEDAPVFEPEPAFAPAFEPVAEEPEVVEPEVAEPVEEPAPAVPTFSMPKLATAEIPAVTAEQIAPASPFARSPYGAAFAGAEQPAITPAPLTRRERAAQAIEPQPEPQPEPEPAPQPERQLETPAEFDALSIPLLEPEDETPADEAIVTDAPEAAEAPAPVMPWASVAEPRIEAPAAWPVPGAQPIEPVENVSLAETDEPAAPAFAPIALVEDPAPEVADAVAAPEPEPAAETVPEAPAAPWLDAAAFAAAAAEHEHAREAARVHEETIPEAPAVEDATHGGPSIDDIIAEASGHEAGREGFFGRLFGRGRRDAEPAGKPFAQEPSPAFAPASVEPATQPEAFQPGAFEPAALPEPVAPVAETVATPEPVAAEPERAWATSFEPEAPAADATQDAPAEPYTPWTAASFQPEWPAAAPAPEPAAALTPEQLAEAHGWESAGASALAAAGEESVAQSYQPVIDTEHSSGRGWEDEVDLTRAAFSELSSLSESRPRVEKTKAGLQKRRRPEAAPVETTPLEDEVTLAPKERDAEAVRSRFSSFYSGTQRARSDAAELDLHSPQPANE
ncbi:HAMP domain-containing histidine kinase [Demequina silvatica]|uniref:HAMP domain-containing histidine kinase n=1 Tax=Demequina silvatica TaxID=1638988 RepID=UPI000AB4F0F0|nr:HAMP domain-containing histidine kinase [Demequina silvatica]